MTTSVTYTKPGLGDIVACGYPLIQAVEFLGSSWNARRVLWYRGDDRQLVNQDLGPLRPWMQVALKLLQLVLLPLTLLCVGIKYIRRRTEPVHDLYGNEIVMPTNEFLQARATPEAILMIGSTGAGKSRVTSLVESSSNGQLVRLDPDDLMGNIPEYTYQVERGIDRAAENYHTAGSRLRDTQFRVLMSHKQSMIIETTSPLKPMLQWVVTPLRQAGYRIKIVYVDTRLDICITRARWRTRQVPQEVIERAHKDANECFEGLKPHCHEWERYDNNGEMAQSVEKSPGGLSTPAGAT